MIVDDSALMRRLLSDLLGSAPEIEIVGTARDGREAVLQAARLKPDVITLDVEMPEVSGLEALPALLAVHEVPVVMVSALTQEGADVTLQALELGAVDFMPKPERNQLAEMRASRDLLVAKVLAAAQSRVRRPRRAGRSATSRISERLPRQRSTVTSRPPSRSPGASAVATYSRASSQSDMYRHRHLHRRSAGTEPDLSAAGFTVATHPGRSAHAGAVHGYLRRTTQSLQHHTGQASRRGRLGTPRPDLDRTRWTAHATDRPSAAGTYRTLRTSPPLAATGLRSTSYFNRRPGHIRQPTIGILMTGMGRDGVRAVRLFSRLEDLPLARMRPRLLSTV